MNRCERSIGAIAIVLAFSMGAVATAQPPGRGPGGPGGPGGFGMMPGGGGSQMIRLLGLPEVQQELELVDDQKNKLKGVEDDLRQRAQKEMAGIRDLPQEERRAKFDEMQKKAKTWGDEAQKRIEEILLPHQMDRLHEISLQVSLQVRGASALADPKIQAELGLNEQQKTKLRDLSERTQKEVRGLWEGLRELPEEARRAKMAENREKTQKITKDASDQALATLNPQQRAKLEEMKGKKVDIQFPQRGPRDRGPGAPKPKP
jgi:Spy/CpxP family protein refolding chaperone